MFLGAVPFQVNVESSRRNLHYTSGNSSQYLATCLPTSSLQKQISVHLCCKHQPCSMRVHRNVIWMN